MNIGRVEEQFTMSGARLAGDADQFLLPENWDLNWIKKYKRSETIGGADMNEKQKLQIQVDKVIELLKIRIEDDPTRPILNTLIERVY